MVFREPSVQRLVPIEKMISWSFYPRGDAMTGRCSLRNSLSNTTRSALG
jgi:hypothetical protein